jgi:uncharacterized membrane protein YkvA (DUF1232 family)
MGRLQKIFNTFKQEIAVYQLVLKDSRTPRLAKWLLGFAVGYALCPFDIIPDFIPIIGHLDDLIIVPLLIFIAIKVTPRCIIQDCRKKISSSI